MMHKGEKYFYGNTDLDEKFHKIIKSSEKIKIHQIEYWSILSEI
jgi:hypothetical protein